MSPRVRVVVPTYNRASLLERALESVSAQTYRDFEVVVADDGSDDETQQVVGAFEGRGFPIRCLRLSHGGVSRARNAAIAATGRPEFVAFLDSDDVWLTGHLAASIAALDDCRHAVLSFGPMKTIDYTGRWTPERFAEREERTRRPLEQSAARWGDLHLLDWNNTRRAVLRGEFHPHPSTVVVRANTLPTPPFAPDLHMLEDVQLFIRLLDVGTFVFLDELQGVVEYRGDNLSGMTDLTSPRTLRQQRCAAAFARWKLARCAFAYDRRVVRVELAGYSYLVGQCCTEQGDAAAARRAYVESLRAAPSTRALRGIVACSAPAGLVQVLRRMFGRAGHPRRRAAL
ncbi:MAG TPA: glycosyltransferase family A protein [Vicinamibacterales bacterium]|nr:glycosyltransferase family A protein [Vicinamibacterales bacterium]